MVSSKSGAWSVAVATAVCAVLIALPRIAEACPYCAANDDNGDGRSQLFVLGGMILLPFAVAGVVVFAVVRNLRKARANEADQAARHAGDW